MVTVRPLARRRTASTGSSSLVSESRLLCTASGSGGQFSSGKLNLISVPLPRSLRMSIRPPDKSTICFTMLIPRPVPGAVTSSWI
jgi:hypothetical protein